MSTASKVVLGVSVVLTLSTVAAVHLKQTWDRQVNRSEPRQDYGTANGELAPGSGLPERGGHRKLKDSFINRNGTGFGV